MAYDDVIVAAKAWLNSGGVPLSERRILRPLITIATRARTVSRHYDKLIQAEKKRSREALAAERARVVDALTNDVHELTRRGLHREALTLRTCIRTLPPIGGWTQDTTAAARGTGEG